MKQAENNIIFFLYIRSCLFILGRSRLLMKVLKLTIYRVYTVQENKEKSKSSEKVMENSLKKSKFLRLIQNETTAELTINIS
jgi:hypothetical protein